MTHVVWVTNIPTPYRNHRYDTMMKVFPDFGLTFEVLYLARTEPGRHWTIEESEMTHPHAILGGVSPTFRGINLHTNPSLPTHLRRARDNILIVSGYYAPSLAAAPFLARGARVKLLEIESNLASSTYDMRMARSAKRFLIGRYDGYIIPGEPTRAYVTGLDPVAARKPFIELPNIIDDGWQAAVTPDQIETTRDSLGVGPDDQLWVCVARLEPFKGLSTFIPLLDGVSRVQMVVAGEGSERPELEALIAHRHLPVQLIGHVDAELLKLLYRAADVFVLPSLQDPSPLSAVEAAASSLPMILSRAVGNARDIVGDRDNGWVIDMSDLASTSRVIHEVAAESRAALAERGIGSTLRYRRRFDSTETVRNLASSLASLTGAAR